MSGPITRYVTLPLPSSIPGSSTPFRARLGLRVSEDNGVTRIEGLDIRPDKPSLGTVLIAAVRQLKLEPPVVATHDGVDVFYRGASTRWKDDVSLAKMLDSQWKLRRALAVLAREQPAAVQSAWVHLSHVIDSPLRADVRPPGQLAATYRGNLEKAYEEITDPVEIHRYLQGLSARIAPEGFNDLYNGLATLVVGGTPGERRDEAARQAAWVVGCLRLLESAPDQFAL